MQAIGHGILIFFFFFSLQFEQCVMGDQRSHAYQLVGRVEFTTKRVWLVWVDAKMVSSHPESTSVALVTYKGDTPP